MDANNNIIPIVEGDQGEGFKDPYEGADGPFGKLIEKRLCEMAQEKLKESLRKELVGAPELEDNSFEKQAKSLMDTPKKQGVFEDIQSLEPPPPQSMRIQKGMVIHFYGYAYKCTAARPNGKVTLRFKGLWKGKM